MRTTPCSKQVHPVDNSGCNIGKPINLCGKIPFPLYLFAPLSNKIKINEKIKRRIYTFKIYILFFLRKANWNIISLTSISSKDKLMSHWHPWIALKLCFKMKFIWALCNNSREGRLLDEWLPVQSCAQSPIWGEWGRSHRLPFKAKSAMMPTGPLW